MFGLIKHIWKESKRYLWENFKKNKAVNMATERFVFDSIMLDALIQNTMEGVIVSVRTKEGDVYTFSKAPMNKPQTQSQPYF